MHHTLFGTSFYTLQQLVTMPHWENISIDIKHLNVAGDSQSHTQCSIQDVVLHTLSAEMPIFHILNQNFRQLIDFSVIIPHGTPI